MSRFVVLLCLLTSRDAAASQPPDNRAKEQIVKFASPLQSLTIWDKVVANNKSPRSQFLPKYKAGLEAERETRKELANRPDDFQKVEAGEDWAETAAAADRLRREESDILVEHAFDEASASVSVAATSSSETKGKDPNGFQFVGVVNKESSEKPITWYARKKPANAKWSVRLVHVNRDAIVKDLFNRGKVDICARYTNTGQVDEETQKPIVRSNYEVKERSWRTLWNFSPKHFFTDSSGMYWRERRLRPGMYTDGNDVYQASYRYQDGRNGMRFLSPFDFFLDSPSVDPSKKAKITKRLKEDAPDVVLEQP